MKASDEYKVGSLEDAAAAQFNEKRDYQYELPFDQPVCYAMVNKDGSIYDVISCKEHDREEGEYTVPLYRHPKELSDEKILEVIRDTPFIDGYLNKNLITFARAVLKKD